MRALGRALRLLLAGVLSVGGVGLSLSGCSFPEAPLAAPPAQHGEQAGPSLSPPEVGRAPYAVYPAPDAAEGVGRVSRGSLVSALDVRLSYEEFEAGVFEHLARVFPPDRYGVRAGLYPPAAELGDWLKPYDAEKNPLGVNPPDPVASGTPGAEAAEAARREPRAVAVLAYNLYTSPPERNTPPEALALGLGVFAPAPEEAENFGRKAGEKIVHNLRSEGFTGDVWIAVYRLPLTKEAVPGTFVAFGLSKDKGGSFVEWETFRERYVLLSRGEDLLSQKFQGFVRELRDSFPQGVYATGTAHYVRDALVGVRLVFTTSLADAVSRQALVNFAVEKVNSLVPSGVSLVLDFQSFGRTYAVYIRDPAAGSFLYEPGRVP
ncbi:MAG: hypothetical protein BLITH_0333 [Brockia lithotrophica]|uniref:Protein involved in sex pheromone biosynthesis n=1 Tax=Brockia lithotrophica TaxID=933949 RepID=A0A2T5GAP6_9BACL|nr:CamS family sex pheromone protein [Brockia lithotrophica]PTQ53253.1 MAG: hypothetical protein BLITH_0333 [Brockia lithotrophica]